MNTHCVEPLETSENFSSSEMLPEPDEHELESTVGGDVVGPPDLDYEKNDQNEMMIKIIEQ